MSLDLGSYLGVKNLTPGRGVASDLTWHEFEGKGIRGGIPFGKSRMYNTMAIMFVPHPSPQGGPLPYR